MTDNEVWIKLIQYLIVQAKNSEYISKLESIISGLENKSHVEETDDPRYKSILMFGYNIFPFSMKNYREMVLEIEG